MKTKKTTTAQNRIQNLGMKCFSKDLGQGNDEPHKQQEPEFNSGAKKYSTVILDDRKMFPWGTQA